jgi:fructose-1,6-bisphosphatase I
MTLETWLIDAQASGRIPALLGGVIANLSAAVKELSDVLRVAAIEGHDGYEGAENVHGEAQKRLDLLADEIFARHLERNSAIGAYVSEEQVAMADLARPNAPYAVCFDPLDGSSNSDVNMIVGSIFSVQPWAGGNLLLPGRAQVAAGFAAYGPATTLVVTFGVEAALFQLEPRTGTFLLIDPALQIARRTTEYAINSSRAVLWDAAVATYVGERTHGEPRFNMRWTGSMVADVQRILRRGGIFLYPADAETQHKGGRLRLLYEAAPIALIVEAAGGRASTGRCDLLDVIPADVHQRVPVILGSAQEVERLVASYDE